MGWGTCSIILLEVKKRINCFYINQSVLQNDVKSRKGKYLSIFHFVLHDTRILATIYTDDFYYNF